MLKAFDEIPEGIDFGCRRKDLGTHSSRKFAESFAASKVDGPSRTQVCLRAGQSVGKTQDCYIFAEPDGDSLVGRTLALLKFDADEFDALPPHFGPDTLQELNVFGWSNILPWYDNLPPSYQRTIPYLFASLVYHYHQNNLDEVIPPEHPLYDQRIFTDRTLLNELKEKVILTHAYCESTQMSANGVPGIIALSRDVRRLQRLYEGNREELRAVSAEINVGINELSARIQNLFESQPAAVVREILSHVNVNGAQMVTMENVQRMLDELFRRDNRFGVITDALAEINARLLMGARDTAPTEADLVAAGQRAITANSFFWGGRYHPVPETFTWPTGKTTRTMGEYWFLGDRNAGIPAFRIIKPAWDLRKTCRVNYARAKRVITVLLKYAVDDNLLGGERDVTAVNSQAIFEAAFTKLAAVLYGEVTSHRSADITCSSVYERMRKKM